MTPDQSSARNGAPLTDKLLDAIATHLNQDHREDMLACAQAAGLHWADQARVIRLDAAGITLEVCNGDRVESLRLDFPAPAQGVLAFKRTLGALIIESRAKLGWPAVVDD